MKRILSLLFIFVLSLGTVGCSNKSAEPTKPQIYTSFYAIYDFTREIAGDNVNLRLSWFSTFIATANST